jgi:hypothetical protein
VPMVALAAFIVVPNLPDTRATVEQRVLQAVPRWWNRRRNAPGYHLNDPAIVMVDALVEQQLGLQESIMALRNIWRQ